MEEDLNRLPGPPPREQPETPVVRAMDWTGIFGFNVFIPGLLGLLITQNNDGWIGMILAVVLCWAVGLVLCTRFHRLYHVLLTGGTFVGSTQFFPILQVGSGILAIYSYEQLAGGDVTIGERGPESALRWFVVTLWTAIPLILAAFLFGGGHRLVGASASEDEEASPQPPSPAATSD